MEELDSDNKREMKNKEIPFLLKTPEEFVLQMVEDVFDPNIPKGILPLT